MNTTLVRLAAGLATLAAATAAGAQQQQGAAPQPAPIERANLDTTCAACANFYQFANGGWLKKTELPAAYGRWGSFEILAEQNSRIVNDIVESAAKSTDSADHGSNVWKIGTFYAACMDTARIEQLGIAPIKPLLDVVAKIGSREDLKKAFGELEKRNGLAPFSFGVGVDPKNSSTTLVTAGQGGLGLPNKTYYVEPRWASVRTAYVAYVARMLTLAGDQPEQAKRAADRVFAIESQLAAASMAPEQMRDPNAVYHRMPFADLQALTPGFDWSRFVDQIGQKGKITQVNVRQPEWFRTFGAMLDSVSVDDWKAYLRWRAIRGMASALSSEFADEEFRFSQQLSGQKEQLPRWKRCTSITNGVLGEAVGQEYVKRTFTPEAKARALHIIDNLQVALRQRIQSLDWMSDSTKTQALAKLDAFTRKIGYPDRWRDYSSLDLRKGAYAENLMIASRWSAADNWGRLGKPVDKTEWGMTPPTVNAYYNPSYNEIVFPAGILQPPFFDPNADDAVNYGAMGAVIGHEMSHGFDDQGRQFDKDGNLRDWWTKGDAAQYAVQAGRVVDQFNSYTVVDSATHVNGKLTLGENIGDLGGLTIAYQALQNELAKNGRPGPVDGFTPEQRFFLGWAQVWRNLVTPQQAKSLIARDPHAPGEWRVNGPLSNMPEFKAAWGCKDGDAMVRPDSLRARIW